MKTARLLAVLAAVLCAGRSAAEIRLDQLASCDDLARAMASLQSPARGCRGAANSIEAAMVARLRFVPGTRHCWLSRAPTESLGRFACLRSDAPDGSPHLDCVAPAQLSDLEGYREDYETVHAARSLAYLRAASTCAVGNRNATRAVRTLMPFLVAQVARFELGFALPVGRGSVGTSVIVHGFASVDPELGSDVELLEFVSMYRRGGE